MPGQEQLQTNVKGLRHARVATERAAESVTRPGERRMGPHHLARRRTVRVVPAQSDESSNRSTWIYVRHALMHPWHVVVLAGATVFGVANWSLFALLLVFVGAELLLLGIVLHLRVFRRYVDERLNQIERAKAAEQRATLLLQMGDDHRRDLLRLESVVDKIRDATKPHGTAAQIAVDQCLRLLANYVRLAMTYNVSRECLASVDRRALDDDARALEAARFSRSEQTRALAQRRLAIARRRAERWDRSREALDAISHQLAMIGELVQLTHEQVAAPADSEGTTDEIDRIVQELDDNQSTIDELAEFLGTEEPIEPRTLEMGRVVRV
jgi:hypothetical protein